jgi:hypothetical protein
VPKGPYVVFHRIEDPDVPWRKRLLYGFFAMLITLLAVTGIVAFAALVKDVYDRMDEADKARAEHAARQREAESRAEDGVIPLTLSDRPPQDESPETPADSPPPESSTP